MPELHRDRSRRMKRPSSVLPTRDDDDATRRDDAGMKWSSFLGLITILELRAMVFYQSFTSEASLSGGDLRRRDSRRLVMEKTTNPSRVLPVRFVRSIPETACQDQPRDVRNDT